MAGGATLSGPADTLLQAASRAARARGHQQVSGAYVLAELLRDPFPAFRVALRDAQLDGNGLAETVDELLQAFDPAKDGAPPFETTMSELLSRRPGDTRPQLLLRTILTQRDSVVTSFLRFIEEDQPGFDEKLTALADAEISVVQSSPLGSEAISGRVLTLLARADALSEGRKVSIRALLRVWLSDGASVLSKGLLSVGGYDAVLRTVGGKTRVKTPRLTFDVTRVTDYLRSTLEQARTVAEDFGHAKVDERHLAIAIVRQARLDPGSELAQLGKHLKTIESWLVQADDEAPDAVEEVSLEQIVPFLQARVINQDQAITEVYRPVLRVRLGLGFEDALAAVMLFVGPPGVGKSYLAQLMADVLYGRDSERPEAHFVMVECGQYKEEHAAANLFGAVQGYVGSDKGILREGIRDKSPCVIVFDEAERMHKGVWDSLLTMLNDGVLRDKDGARYPLTDCVVVLTSNAGIRDANDYRRRKVAGDHAAADALAAAARKGLGAESANAGGPREVLDEDEFWSHEDYRENYKAILIDAAREHFGPALFSRIDEKIGFNGLRLVDYVRVAINALDHVIKHLHQRTGVQLWYRDDVPKAIAGIVKSKEDPTARDVIRVVRKYVLDDGFALLKLNELSGVAMAASYRIDAVYEMQKLQKTAPKVRVFTGVKLVEAPMPSEPGPAITKRSS